MTTNRRPSPATIKGKLHEIKRRYKWHYRNRPRSPRQIAGLRLNDLGKLFKARYGGPLPDDDSGRDDMMLALHHLIGLPQGPRRCVLWLDVWAPWMTGAERNELIAQAATTSRAWTADQLAWRLGLTMADRTALGITTIGAVDCNKGQRTKLRKAKDKERKRLMRLRLKSASAP